MTRILESRKNRPTIYVGGVRLVSLPASAGEYPVLDGLLHALIKDRGVAAVHGEKLLRPPFFVLCTSVIASTRLDHRFWAEHTTYSHSGRYRVENLKGQDGADVRYPSRAHDG